MPFTATSAALGVGVGVVTAAAVIEVAVIGAAPVVAGGLPSGGGVALSF